MSALILNLVALIQVLLLVSSQSISAPGDVVAGRPFTLECTVNRTTGDRSAVFWTRDDGQNISRIYASRVCNSSIPLSPSSPVGLSGGCQQVNGEEVYTVTIENVTKDTGRGRWICQYEGQSRQVTLDVKDPPQSDILLSGYVNNTAVESGETLTLTCQVGKGNPRPALSWTSGCGQTSPIRVNDGSQQISISIIVSPSLNQKTCVCKGSQDGALTGWTEQESRTFNVTFGPGSVQLRADSGQTGNTVAVPENSTVTFTCTSGESNPAAVLSWYNNNSPVAAAELSQVSSQRGSNHGYLTTQRHTVRVDRYQDGDVIRCEAQRPGNGNSKRVSRNLTLSVTYIPRVVCSRTDLKVFEGQRIELSCDVMSKPEATVTWLKDGGQVDGVSSRTSKQRDVIVATLQVDVHNNTSPGIYEILAANAVGTIKETIRISMNEGQPLPEQIYLDSNSCLNNHATLLWASGIDDSVMAYYKLEYKGNQDVWQEKLVRNPGRGKLVLKTLTDLQSEVFYQFRLRPVSDFLVPFFRTKNCTVKGLQSGEKRTTEIEIGLSKLAMLGVGIAVGVCFVALFGAVVICLLLHTRKLTWTKRKNDGVHVHGDPEKYSNKTAETTGNRSKDPPLGQYGDLNTRPISGAKYEELSVRPALPVSAEKAVYVNATVM